MKEYLILAWWAATLYVRVFGEDGGHRGCFLEGDDDDYNVRFSFDDGRGAGGPASSMVSSPLAMVAALPAAAAPPLGRV